MSQQQRTLADELAGVDAQLPFSSSEAGGGGQNAFGDVQLEADLQADKLVFKALKGCRAVATASSEETSACVDLGGEGFSVAFDPLDGSSIIGANFAVGTIAGIWPGETLLGRTGREQVAALYTVYGPRTVLVLARPTQGGDGACRVQEYVLTGEQGQPSEWRLTRPDIELGGKPVKVFAPANLRAAADNAAYARLVRLWHARRYTLRYTGGMVPDVHHLLTKGGGIFCSPVSATAPAKLRLLYECAPLAFVVEAVGGASHDGEGSVLDRRISSTGDRLGVALGSGEEVQRAAPCLKTCSLPSSCYPSDADSMAGLDRFLLPPGRDARLLRALYAEFLGTLLFQLFAGLTQSALAIGISYGVFVYGTQHVSGGHLNPALTLATIISGHFHLVTGLLYFLAQILGALVGSLLQVALIPTVHLGKKGSSPGCFVPDSHLSDFNLFGWELVLTFVLVWILYSVGIAKPGHGSLGPLALGLAVYIITIVGGPYSGASANPARILGNALVYFCNARSSWVYIGGQTIGAALASALAGTIFGFGGVYAQDSAEATADDPSQPLAGSEQRV